MTRLITDILDRVIIIVRKGENDGYFIIQDFEGRDSFRKWLIPCKTFLRVYNRYLYDQQTRTSSDVGLPSKYDCFGFDKSFDLFPKRQILDTSELKGFADDNSEFNEGGGKFSEGVENTVGKGEIVR